MSNKLVVLTAPSGAGKSSICSRVMKFLPDISFSVSATTRPTRAYEEEGVHYRFLSIDEFRQRISNREFLEYEEVYPGILYGTLRTDVESALMSHHVLLDIDVKGAKRVKEIFGDRALVIFVKPPSLNELRVRLTKRNTEDQNTLEMRLRRAEEELEYEQWFDATVVNDTLDEAARETITRIEAFIKARTKIDPKSK